MIVIYIFDNKTGDDIHDYEAENAPLVGDIVLFNDREEGILHHCLVKSRSWDRVVVRGDWYDTLGLHCDITEEKYK